MIKIDHLRAGYGSVSVLQDLSLHLPKGKITTLVGPNGCGKSTLLKVLTGSLTMQSGTILLEDQLLSTLSPALRAQRIAYLPQMRSTPDITVDRMVLHGRFPYLSYPRKYRKEDYQLAKEAMKEMDLLDYADRNLTELSGGIRQKVYIAMALAQNAPVILMDEPTSFLDIEHQIQFMQLLKDLSARGKTILLVLHDLLAAMKISDHLAVMQAGEMIFQGTPEDFLQQNISNQVYQVTLGTLNTENGPQFYYNISLDSSDHTTNT